MTARRAVGRLVLLLLGAGRAVVVRLLATARGVPERQHESVAYSAPHGLELLFCRDPRERQARLERVLSETDALYGRVAGWVERARVPR